jgi:hypothetical protein
MGKKKEKSISATTIGTQSRCECGRGAIRQTTANLPAPEKVIVGWMKGDK